MPDRFYGPGCLLFASLSLSRRLAAADSVTIATPGSAASDGVAWNGYLIVSAAVAAILAVTTFRLLRALRRERALREKIVRENGVERRQTRVTAGAADWIATVDPAGRILWINDAGRKRTGNDAGGRLLTAWFHTADRAVFEDAFCRALQGAEPAPFEARHPAAEGQVDFEFVVRCSAGERGPELHCVGRDITSRKRIEVAAREAIQRQRAHVDNTPLGVIEWNSRFEVVAWNPAAERIFGWTATEALGRTAEFITPVAGRRVLDRMWESVVGRRFDPQVTDNLASGGRTIQCKWYHTPLLSAEGSVAGVTSLVRDVTQQRATALQLEESEQRHRLVLSALAEGVLVADAGAMVRSANESAERITGFPAVEMTGMRVFEWAAGFLDDDGLEVSWENTPLARALLDGARTHTWTMGLRRGDGRPAWLSGHVRSFPASSGAWAGARVISFADVTAERESLARRRTLEAQLLQSQKMEALGTLAGGVAHDFNNVLAMILGQAELVRSDLTPGSETHGRAEDIAVAARRGAEVVARILAFSRPQAASRTPVRLSAVVRDVLRLARVGMPQTLEIVTRVDDDEPAMCGDTAQLRQLVLNLLTNAAHAMESVASGVLTISVRRSGFPAGDAPPETGRPAGDAVHLSVADTGSGMTPEIRRRLFEPFFTTKPPGKGTGLGLSVVHGILQAHKGVVRVESRPGDGTRFDLYFPAATGAVENPVPMEDDGSPAGGAEHVLIVDDEKGVLSFTKAALARLGYRVSAYSDPVEALEAFRCEPGRFDVVLTDLSMPFMTGAELAIQIRAINPVVPVLLASGYAASDRLNDDDRRLFAAVLAKPFRIGELGSLIRDTLDVAGRPSHGERLLADAA